MSETLVEGTNNFKEVLREDPKWMNRGACYGTSVNNFFIERGDSGEYREVIANFCNVCVVKTSCLNYAIDNYVSGIWGGTTDRGRQRIRREQRK